MKNLLVVNQFKSLVRKSLYNYSIDIYRKRKRRREIEIITDKLFDNLDYYEEECFFENMVAVLDFKMTVKNDLLYEVLNSMEQHQRDIVYLSLCEEWSDKKIGITLNMSRSKVQRIKQQMKKEIYEAMTGGNNNGCKTD